jgi:hypothetical protein
MHAAFELYVAARTEPDLARGLAPVIAAHYGNLHSLARELFPSTNPAQTLRFDAVVDLIIGAFQGVALGNLASRSTERTALVEIVTELAAGILVAENN